jgi:hypothetical protein
MDAEYALQLINQYSIKLDNCGIDNLPGKQLFLDTEQIEVEKGELTNLLLYAWYDDERVNHGKTCNKFIIRYYGHVYIFLDYFHEVIEVWQYLKETFQPK